MEPPKQRGVNASQNNSNLPSIHTEEEKKKLREELEEEYFKQRAELKKMENKTKLMSQ